MEGKGENEKGPSYPTTTAMYFGEVPLMAAVAELTNAASPLLKRSREGVEEGARVLLTK
jgi:hypothetical protein